VQTRFAERSSNEVSLVHYLTVGRFGFTERSVPPNLVDRVVAHFVPGGLRQLGGETSFIVPWNEDELGELEDAVKTRYELELNLSDHLTREGLLSIQYTGVEIHIAFPVAAVAAEMFGASAGERGQTYDPETVRENAEEHAAENKQRRRISGIASGSQRLQAVVDALRAGAPFLPPWLAERLLAPVAPQIVDELVSLLGSENARLRRLGVGVLREAGPAAAAAAVPALTALLRKTTERVDAFLITFSLAGLGQGAEPGLVEALNHDGAQMDALEALAKLPSLSEPTRARLATIAVGKGEIAAMARHVLGQSAIAKRLARLRETLATRDARAQSRTLSERVRRGELETSQLGLAAHLGDTASQIVVTGAAREPTKDLRTWAVKLLELRPECVRQVVAAVLDARSVSLQPRSASLTQDVARAVCDGTAASTFQKLLDKHDWMNIPGLDLMTLQNAVAAAETSGDEQRQHLCAIMETLIGCDGVSDFFLLLQEEAIPTVLGEREVK
jgi:hypothetical protein